MRLCPVIRVLTGCDWGLVTADLSVAVRGPLRDSRSRPIVALDIGPMSWHRVPMEQDLRAATGDDLGAVVDIVRSAYAHYVSRIGREPGPMLDDYSGLIRQGRVHVIEHDGTVRGVLVLIPQEDAMLLDNVAVSPLAQGLGLGRKMLAFAERAAIDAGYRSIRLYTNEVMTENIELYTRIGYAETHRVEEKGLRRVYMTKRVGQPGELRRPPL